MAKNSSVKSDCATERQGLCAAIAFGAALLCCAASSAGAVPVKLLVHNATLVTLEPDQPEPFLGYLAVGADGRIAEIG